MRKPAVAPRVALASLQVRETGPCFVRLGSPRAVAEMTVLADDLFRLRVAPVSGSLPKPSWAVVKTDWPAVAVQVRATAHRVTVATAAGAFTFNLRDGGWRVVDCVGCEVFSAPAGALRFEAGRPRFSLALAEDESLFGLGETTGTFNKRGLTRELWNIDVLGHASAIHPGLSRFYSSIPFLISLRHGRAAGVFWDNPARQVWDLGNTQSDCCAVAADSGEIDLYLFLGPTLAGVVGRYTELTGRMPLPPLWALGYQQCRYSYETRGQIEEIAQTFRRKRIPCDVLYLDIHHMDGYRVFTFGRSFPQPAQLMRQLARRGFKVVPIVDPGVKDERRFGVLKRGRRLDAFVKGPDGKHDFIGKVWPGKSRFPDFLQARVRAWWGREQARLQDLGVAGFWNDMNEPANFASPAKTLEADCWHATDHGPRRHAQVHNVYGMQMARASAEGALSRQPDRRPFIITRAGYAGVQRHALIWTGDNSSCWEHLTDSLQMLLNLGLSGVAHCGSDVGGFLDNATGELLARWTQMAAFTPFFRNHSNLGTRAQEPWAFGDRVEAICRRYLELRYQLLPYIYGLFVEAHRHGVPIMRPLSWHFQNDPVAVGTGDQFMLGPSLLIAPVLRQGAVARSVYLPVGNWFDFWTGERLRGRQHVIAQADLERIPLFVRAGAIVPFAPLQQYVGEKKADVINLHLWPGSAGELDWYEDDGLTLAYSRGEFRERRIRFRGRRRGGELRFDSSTGSYADGVKRWRVLVRGVRRAYRVSINGELGGGSLAPGGAVFAFEFRDTSGEICARWW